MGNRKILSLFLVVFFSFGCKEMLEKKKKYRESVLNETLKEASKNISGALYSEKVDIIKGYLKVYTEDNVFKSFSHKNCKGVCENNWIKKITIIPRDFKRNELKPNIKNSFSYDNKKFNENENDLIYKNYKLHIRSNDNKSDIDLGVLRVDYSLE